MKMKQADLAIKWGTTQKNISLMMGKGCDFTASDESVAEWLLANTKRKSKPMREAIAKVLKPEAIEAIETGKKKSLEEMRDYYAANLDRATRAESVDRESVKFWNDLLLKVDESIRKSEAHAKKLGIDRGELLSREEVERILRALFWAVNACSDKFAKQMAQHLSDKSPAEVYDILAPNLTARVFDALKKVAKTPGEINLPEYIIECATAEEQQYIEYDD